MSSSGQSTRSTRSSVPPNGWTRYYIWSSVGVVCWLGAAVVWLLLGALTSRLWKDGAAPDNNMRATDQWVVALIVWLQPATGDEPGGHLEHVPGSTHHRRVQCQPELRQGLWVGTLDVLTKGGLALYCASRLMNVVD